MPEEQDDDEPKKPARPKRPAKKADDEASGNDMPWDDETFRTAIARKMTESEALPYRVWARKAENPRYALSSDEKEALFQSWDMTLMLVGPSLPLGLVAGGMFLIGHFMPLGMRLAFPPRPLTDEEKAEWRASKANPVEVVKKKKAKE